MTTLKKSLGQMSRSSSDCHRNLLRTR